MITFWCSTFSVVLVRHTLCSSPAVVSDLPKQAYLVSPTGLLQRAENPAKTNTLFVPNFPSWLVLDCSSGCNDGLRSGLGPVCPIEAAICHLDGCFWVVPLGGGASGCSRVFCLRVLLFISGCLSRLTVFQIVRFSLKSHSYDLLVTM